LDRSGAALTGPSLPREITHAVLTDQPDTASRQQRYDPLKPKDFIL
jgi:hypothetical protein